MSWLRLGPGGQCGEEKWLDSDSIFEGILEGLSSGLYVRYEYGDGRLYCPKQNKLKSDMACYM